MRQVFLEGRALPIFPCSSLKRPRTPRGFYSASSDPQEIERLFTRWPGDLLGVPTGAPSGFDVLDVDPEGMSWWHEHREKIPRTLTVETPRAGLHLYFQHAEGLRCSASKL